MYCKLGLSLRFKRGQTPKGPVPKEMLILLH